MKTYEDLLKYVDNDDRKMQFVFEAITEHKNSDTYKDAVTAYEYYKKRNTTILNYQKLLYTISGESVPDNYSANYKLCNAFFSIFVKQEVSYLLNNGTDFIEDSTKDKLGGAKFDVLLQRLAKYALWGGVAFGFWNIDKLEVFNIGTGHGCSTKEIVDAFQKATGVKLNWTYAPRRAGDVEKVWANPEKANNILGWKADTSLEDTLKSAWNWQKKLREEGIQ